MTHIHSNSTATKAQLAEINEIKHLSHFYKATHPDIATMELLKYIGFNIAGLQWLKRAKVGSSETHRLLQHKTLPWAVCSCGHFDVAATEAQAKIEHGRHRSHARKPS
jgi:hypothetical protein